MDGWLLLTLKGIAIGVAVAAPLGAVGVLVIRRALTDRPWTAFIAGLGAAAGDAFFAAVAGFGLTAITQTLDAWQRPLRIGGGALIIAMGLVLLYRMRRSHDLESIEAPAPRVGDRRRSFFAALALTLGNPVTLFSMIAIFAAAGLGRDAPTIAETGLLVCAVFVGSALWFLFLSRCAYAVSRRYGERAARLFDAMAALLLIALGVLALLAPSP